jgi:hypothetical protein
MFLGRVSLCEMDAAAIHDMYDIHLCVLFMAHVAAMGIESHISQFIFSSVYILGDPRSDP